MSGLRYGLLGLPLAFVALPLYVQWPAYYASEFGVPLAALGGLLLLVRAADAVVDPWLGLLGGRWLARGRAVCGIAWAALALWLGFLGLFFPPLAARSHPLAWAAAALVLTYAAFSAATLTHQAWAARLPGGEAAQPRWMAWREGAGLAGVVLASVLPAVVGWPTTAAVLALTLAVACLALRGVPQAPSTTVPRMLAATPAPRRADLWRPWRDPRWRGLLGVYVLNGIANAIPATLVLFFVRDRLRAPELEGAFLAAYFVTAALSLPVWVRVVARFGLARTWLGSMGLAVVSFVGAGLLGAGDVAGFLAVCLATGLALGADLIVPPALLMQCLRGSSTGATGGSADDGVAFGWWAAATKLNLALAAGLALPLLGWAAYAPGVQDPQALRALTLAYSALPCVLKLTAMLALATWLRRGRHSILPTPLESSP